MKPAGRLWLLILWGWSVASGAAAEAWPDIRSIEPDLEVPPTEVAEPAPGRRVYGTTSGWRDTQVFHALYLPRNWKPGARFPVIVEYPGNGGFRNSFGDVSDGGVEQCRIGYGVSAGVDYLWVALPFVEETGEGWGNCPRWWGSADATARYCVETVRELCREFGGDERAVVLAGFSRGAIAANYIGLRDETIAPLWRAFICHSHYDGVRTSWPYHDADRGSALRRLRRLRGRPQFVSHEGSATATRQYLAEMGVEGAFTVEDFRFRNHTDLWALRDTDLRRSLRDWLRAIGLPAPGGG